MDIGDTLTPNSDRITNLDLLTGPRIVTIVRKEVTPYKPGIPKNQQFPVALFTAEFGEDRPYRPQLSMRKLLADPRVWGGDSSLYVGRRIELFRDDTVKIGPKSKPGVRISAVSHISQPVTVTMAESQIKDRTFTVQPLPDMTPDAPKITNALTAITNATDVTKLDAIEAHAVTLGIHEHPDVKGAILARRGELG